MDSFELEIATPERLVLKQAVREAQIPARSGYLGVLPDHAPLIAELGTGELQYVDTQGARAKLAISGGFLQIDAGHAMLLADIAELPSEINAAQAEAQLREVEALTHSSDPSTDYDAALHQAELSRARLAASR